jgi:hypothetical protein
VQPTSQRPLRRWGASVTFVVLGLAATSSGFGNRFTQDDLPQILRNGAVQSLGAPAQFFTLPYWHDPFPAALYRPLVTASHALQWAAGGGSPALFRWVSAFLLIAAGVALYRLGARLCSPAGAWVAAALFLAHPLHVETTALAVNQSEIAVTLLLCLGTGLYIRDRRSGGLQPRTAAGLVVLYIGAVLYKENGLVFPALLVASELTLLFDPRPVKERLRTLRPFYLFLGLTAVAFVAARSAVLGGDTIGTPAAEALAGAGMEGRALTMLDVSRHWARLLFWPSHLQADYGPREIVAASGWGGGQWLGLALLAAWAGALTYSWRRRPSAAFALLWIAVAILPVSNVLVPTGVVLAERTLFLASAGAALLAGVLVSALLEPVRQLGSRWRWATSVGVAILLLLGLSQSRSRHRAWEDQKSILEQTVLDAPRSYAAHLALGRFLDDSGHVALAEPHFREAAQIEPALIDREGVLAEAFRHAGYCRAAIRYYRIPLLVRPTASDLRLGLVKCLLEESRYREARVAAEPAVNDPRIGVLFLHAIRTADSALAPNR